MKRYDMCVILRDRIDLLVYPDGRFCKWEDIKDLIEAGACVAESYDKDQERISALETTIKTFLHDLDAHEKLVCPSEIKMNSAMWMQVQAFRNLLEVR